MQSPRTLAALIAITGCAHSSTASRDPAPPAPVSTVQPAAPGPGPRSDSGEVTRDGLEAFVRLQQARIRDCYEKELQKDHALKGQVVMLFTVTPAGRAAEISVEENAFSTKSIPACLQGVIEGWVFPFRPAEDTPVAYPFVFSPVE